VGCLRTKQGLKGIKAVFACKLVDGSSINHHVIKMIDYIETLTKLGYEIKDDLATDVILQSLLMSYEMTWLLT
jgi:hypothetical protein